MSFSRDLQAPSRWNLQLKTSTPDDIRKLIVARGHIMVTDEWTDPRRQSDATMKALSQYTGRVLRISRGQANEVPMQMGGDHVTAWLGDADGRGEIRTVKITFTAEPWSTFVPQILPASITSGTHTNNPGTVSASYFSTTAKQELDHAAQLAGAEYRVNDDGSLDSGIASDLYVTTPTAIVAREGVSIDPDLVTLASPDMVSFEDATKWIGEAFIAGTGDFANGGEDIIIGQADLTDIAQPNPYKDLHGNPDGTGALLQDPVTFAAQGDTRAQLLLTKQSQLLETITISLDEFDVSGDFSEGDSIFVYDPPRVVDLTNPVRHGGRFIYPKVVRVFGLTFPSRTGMGFYYRDLNGNYTDITHYVELENGATSIVIGDRRSSPFDFVAGQVGALQGAINLEPNAVTTPGLVTMTPPFETDSYQSSITGQTFARIRVTWDLPTNDDASPIRDGSHYVVRYRRQ